MRKSLLSGAFALAILVLPTTAVGQTADFNVVPLPKQLNSATDAPFKLSANTAIHCLGSSANMKRNAQMLATYIKQSTGIQPIIDKKGKDGTTIVLGIDTSIDNSEGYRLEVRHNQISIYGASSAGVFYGIQTLRKALPVAKGKLTQVEVPAVNISDEPRFAYRGTHLDVSRHFVSTDSVKRFIDMLALHNINRFHWHLTDDQGWRVEIKKYPRLTSIGSKRDETVIGHNSDKYDGVPYGGFYTQKEIKDIVKYAAERYITIVPEIDLPGHMQAALAAYPEYGCTGGPYKVWTKWGVSDNVLCAGNDKAMMFICDILKEIVGLFPSKYIHIGGDECPKTQWKKCPKCQSRIKDLHLETDSTHSPEECLQSFVVKNVDEYLRSFGRYIIGWDEILEGGESTPYATIMSWRGESGGIAAAKRGYDVIMTPNTYLYFDYYQSADKQNEPVANGGYLPLDVVYGYEPMPKDLDSDEQKFIIGVQANLWTEYMPTYRQVEYMALPRLAALSETQWCMPELKDYDGFRSRLLNLFNVYDMQGYNYAKHLYNVAIDIDSDNKWHEIVVHMSTAGNAEIRYTLDGSEPTAASTLYTGPLHLQQAAKIRAIALRDGKVSRVSAKDIVFNKATACHVDLLQEPHKNYTYGGGAMLTDGQTGDSGFNTGRWLGFSGTDLEAVIDLRKPTEISRLGFNTCVDMPCWVFDAREVVVSTSLDGTSYNEVAKQQLPAMNKGDESKVYKHSIDFDITKARYVKVRIASEHCIPEWHPEKGKEGYLFVDEISIE